MTSSGEDVDLLAGYQNGANSYVVKPGKYVEFTGVVRQLARCWTTVNHQPPTI